MAKPNNASKDNALRMATKKKGNITVNPKKEDLMSETMNSNIRSAMSDIRAVSYTHLTLPTILLV